MKATGGTKTGARKKSSARKPTRPTRPEPVDPPSSPGRDYPYPWMPDLSIHLYGLAVDYEIHPNDNAGQLATKAGLRDALRSSISRVLSALLPGAGEPDIQLAYDGSYVGDNTSTCLSIGFWLQALNGPNDPDAIAARRQGLLSLRRAGRRTAAGDLTLRFGVIDELLRRTLLGLPTLVGRGGPALNVNHISIVPSGANIDLAVFVSTSVPVLGSVNHVVELRIGLDTVSGNLTIGASNLLVSGDFLIGRVDASALLPFIVPRMDQLAPREIFMSDLKLALNYGRPIIERRGEGPFLSGQQALVVPFSWTLGARRPEVRVTGPRAVNITGSQARTTYRATTTDMLSPAFTWKLNGRTLSATGPDLPLVYRAGTQQPGTVKVQRVEVTATEGAPSTVQRTASTTTNVRVLDV